MVIENYTGSKNANGMLQFLCNNTPLHLRYFELFAGSAQYYRNKRSAKFSLINDIDKEVFTKLSDIVAGRNKQCKTIDECTNQKAITTLKSWLFINTDFIYLDPPYPTESRRNPDKKLYRHEMSQSDHIQLLATITDLKAPMIMISTRANDLYDKTLKNWRKATFNTADRGGAAQEIIYMNYPEPKFLHQYDYAGKDYTQRQCIKRKVVRFAKKMKELPGHEKHLLMMEIIKNDPDAMQLFMSMNNS